MALCIALSEFAGGSGSHGLGIETTRLRQPRKLGVARDFREAYPTWTFYTFASCACGVKNLGTGEPWEKMHGVSCQCLVGGDASPMCVHREAHTCPGYGQKVVHGMGSAAAQSPASTCQPWAAHWLPLCRELCAGSDSHFAGEPRELHAFCGGTHFLQALAGSCRRPCASTQRCRH